MKKVTQAAVLVVLGFALAIPGCADDTSDASDNTRPMPCASDEVYIWEHYPVHAVCVKATDHAAHEESGHAHD